MYSKLEKNKWEYFEMYSVNNAIYEFKVAVNLVNCEYKGIFNSVSLFTPIKMYVNTDKLKG